ncbi:GTP pyrophosphokinase [Acinetobacter ursingii]|uniref:RelA/SpoT domain-containing protein n=4 Tax=Acinetobacter TaxID=469 RepID=N9DG42_9GAMM|nr:MULTISPECIES: hypothetical protein [Acinetobacter]ENV79750.1 hypothetical protein F942_01640 [Acinetobacter ursingii ANC 3649]MCU4523289.1 GTP pyrophosphokinase [Acinetobacter ursingii]MDG9948532.1 GTP pyrophosphokinase [Acinetobacter ursingii]MEC6126855.1 GTP pyrophosphokinase [Acinetobacter ursingii]PZT87252.1 MAG: GTP pyrophosphokinase [Acinetobacter sp.]
MSKDVLDKVELMIETINKIHADFSQDYFETGRIEKFNLSKTISRVPYQHIAKYRLNLHESINDYLIKNKKGFLLQYYYRVKTLESIDDKISRFSSHSDQYPVNNWLNDIFGARIILNTQEVKEIIELLDGWQEKFGLKNWYFRDKSGYRGLHIDFKNKSNFYFPWELQVWDEKDELTNIENHENYKRKFV